MFKKITTSLFLFALLVFSAIPAYAHVTVKPDSSTTGAWETYTMKVPVEKDVATNKVAIKVPANVEFKMYQPIAGWKVTTETDTDKKVKTVTWTADKGYEIQAGQFMQFVFTAQNPDKAGEVSWDAYQYYADGSIVEWTGEESDEYPHSLTQIVQATAETDSHGHSHNSTTEATEGEEHSHSSTGTTSIVIACIALLASVLAIFLALRKRN